MRPTGNSPRPTEELGRFASSSQSVSSTAMSEERDCTFSWTLNGGIYIQIGFSGHLVINSTSTYMRFIHVMEHIPYFIERHATLNQYSRSPAEGKDVFSLQREMHKKGRDGACNTDECC